MIYDIFIYVGTVENNFGYEDSWKVLSEFYYDNTNNNLKQLTIHYSVEEDIKFIDRYING